MSTVLSLRDPRLEASCRKERVLMPVANTSLLRDYVKRKEFCKVNIATYEYLSM
jgi:hypothetical protein